MSYHIYNTDALVLRERPRREADRIYSLFTREMGLIRASAGGVRKESSKLRASLEPLSFSKVSLVKGKDHWRITSASLVESLPTSLKDKDTLLSLAKNFSLLEKLVAGEEAHKELYDDIRGVVNFASESMESDAEAVEILLAARMLWHLGYLSIDSLDVNIFQGPLTVKSLTLAKESKKDLVTAINEGIQISGLTK